MTSRIIKVNLSITIDMRGVSDTIQNKQEIMGLENAIRFALLNNAHLRKHNMEISFENP